MGSTVIVRRGHISQEPASMALRCREECPGGGACCLRADVAHTLHICSDRLCECHGRARYEQGGDRAEARGRGEKR